MAPVTKSCAEMDLFPLTDLQRAYYIGGTPGILLGGVPSHAYIELLCDDYDEKKFSDAVNSLVSLHSVFRSHVFENGMQQIFENRKIDVSSLDLSLLHGKRLKNAFLKRRSELFNADISFNGCRPVRFSVTKMPNGKTVIHICCNGMLMDGWSYETLIRDLDRLYNGETFSIAYTFKDYVDYLEKLKKSDSFRKDETYWKNILNDFPLSSPLPLLTDPKNIRNPVGVQICRTLRKNEWNNVALYARKHGVTAFAIMLTAFGKAVELYSGKTRFLINIPVSARPPVSDEAENLIGLYSNFLLFPFEDDEKSSLIDCAHKNFIKLLDLKDHFTYQGTDAIKYLQEKSKGDIISQIVFTSTADITFSKTNSFRKLYFNTYTSQTMVESVAFRSGNDIKFSINYIKDLISGNLMNKIADTFLYSLKQFGTDPEFWECQSSLPMCSADLSVIKKLNDTVSSDNFPTLSELLENSFLAYTDKPAVCFEDGQLSYGNLLNYVSRILGALNDSSKKGGGPVGILLNKGWKQIVAAVAALYGNIAYMPIEPELTEADIMYCIRSAGLSLLITESYFIKKIDFGKTEICNIDDIDLKKDCIPAKPAKSRMSDISIIINTSGSTGKPKSIKLRQLGIVNCLMQTKKIFSLSSKDNLLSVTNFCHDMAIFDTIGMLLYGGCVVVPTYTKQKDPRHWAKLIKKYGITVWCSVPAFMKMLIASGYDFSAEGMNLRLILLGGDWIQIELASFIKKHLPDCRLISVGGPSETTLWSIYHEITEADIKRKLIPYGRPIANMQYYILDKQMRLCPPGVRGTMFIAGVGVAAGYAGLAEETKRKFVMYNNIRVYNSGDMGRYLPDGTIEILGREDYQVKINGKRIELGGIEYVLNTLPGILSSAVVIRNATHKIAAFFTGDSSISADSVKKYLCANLPKYMIPSVIMRLNNIPLTKNGKPDRKSLAAMDIKSYSQDNSVLEKTKSGLDGKLLNICHEIFGNDSISVDDDFYSMGGDSFSALKLITKIKETFDADLSVYDILNQPYISLWAKQIKEISHLSESGSLPKCKSDIESKIVKICGSIFDGRKISIDDNFIELGLNNQNAKRLSDEIKKTFNVEISAYSFFSMPYIKDLVAIIKEMASG